MTAKAKTTARAKASAKANAKANAKVGKRDGQGEGKKKKALAESKSPPTMRLARGSRVVRGPGQSVNFFNLFQFLIFVLLSVLKKALIHKFT